MLRPVPDKTEIVSAIDVGLFAEGVALVGLGVALTRLFAPTATGSAIGLAIVAAGGTLTPTGSLVTHFAKTLDCFAKWVLILTGVGLALLASVVVWSLLERTIKDATNGLAVTLVAVGVTLIPTGATPPGN
jgi:uncharacterized membrane protein